MAFGLVGYVMSKLKYPTAPLVLALILTPLLENSVRQSLSMAAGSPWILVTRPISATFIAIGLCLTAWSLFSRRKLAVMKAVEE